MKRTNNNNLISMVKNGLKVIKPVFLKPENKGNVSKYGLFKPGLYKTLEDRLCNFQDNKRRIDKSTLDYIKLVAEEIVERIPDYEHLRQYEKMFTELILLATRMGTPSVGNTDFSGVYIGDIAIIEYDANLVYIQYMGKDKPVYVRNDTSSCLCDTTNVRQAIDRCVALEDNCDD